MVIWVVAGVVISYFCAGFMIYILAIFCHGCPSFGSHFAGLVRMLGSLQPQKQ